MAAAVGQQDPHLCAEPQHRHQPSPLRRFPRPRQRRCRRHAGLHHELAGHAFVAVPGKDVPYLMPDHRRELVLRLRHVEEALVHADLPARQGERVGFVPIEHPDLPTLRPAAGQDAHDGVRDTLHVAVQERPGGGGLRLDVVERRRAHVLHGGRREEGQLIASGRGDGAARGGHRGHDEDGGPYPFHDLSGLRSRSGRPMHSREGRAEWQPMAIIFDHERSGKPIAPCAAHRALRVRRVEAGPGQLRKSPCAGVPLS